MSTKYVVAAAAVAAVSVEASRPLNSIKDQFILVNRPTHTFDEEQKGWSANAGISGGAGGRPQWNVGVSKSWEEEEQKGWSANAGISGGAGGKPQWNVGVSKSWEEEEAKLRLGKVINKASRTVNRAHNTYSKAQQLGLLDEEAKANWNFNAGINGGAGGKPQWNAQIGATWDEEEQKGWSANAGISGGAGGKPQWNVGVSKSWEEEEAKLRLNKIVKGIKKANNVINKAEQIGLLDEEAKANWNFNAGINGGAGGKPQWNAQIGATWDEEQNKFVNRPTYRPARVFDEEAKANWNFNAGINGGAGGKPQWNAQIGATWEEDQEQLVTTGAVGDEKFNINLNHNSAVKDGRNWKDEIKKAADLWKQAREAGFFDEEQADWNFNAGIQGGAGGKPQWNASIGAKWEEEEEEQRKLIGKLNNALNTIDHAVATAHNVAGLFEEEDNVKVTKAVRAAKKVEKIIQAARDLKILDKETERAFEAKLQKLHEKLSYHIKNNKHFRK